MTKSPKPKTWWTLPSFSFSPAKTFFGLGNAHTITIPKFVIERIMDDKSIRSFLFPESSEEDGGSQFSKIELLVIDCNNDKAEICEAEIRHSYLKERTVVHLQWTKFKGTQNAIRRCFKSEYDQYNETKSSLPGRGVVHHLGANRFAIERRIWDDEDIQKIPTYLLKGEYQS